MCKDVTFILDLAKKLLFPLLSAYSGFWGSVTCAFCNVYIDIRKCDACQAAKLLLLPIHYSSARDSVSDLIAFDREMAGRSSVKQTQIGIFLRGGAERGEGWVKGRTEIRWLGKTGRFVRRKGGEGGEEAIGQFSPTFRSRAHDDAHIFYAHENRGWANEGGREGGKEGLT